MIRNVPKRSKTGKETLPGPGIDLAIYQKLKRKLERPYLDLVGLEIYRKFKRKLKRLSNARIQTTRKACVLRI